MAETYNICLDVGGTKVLGAIFNEKDKIIYRLKKRSTSGGEGTSSQEALYRYFSALKVSRREPQAASPRPTAARQADNSRKTARTGWFHRLFSSHE